MSQTNVHDLPDAFVDGELDLHDQLDMEQRLDREPALRRRVDALRALQAAVREHADYHPAPADFRRRMTTPPAASATAPSRWFAWRPFAASSAFAAALAVTVTVALQWTAHAERLQGDVVASHVRSMVGEHLVDVASADHHKVKPFLSARLGFSPPVGELQLPGSTFVGGRVDYLDDRPVAALVYRQGEHIVDSFVWPDAAPDTTPAFSMRRGFRTAHWSHAGMTHWVVSDVNRTEFSAVIGAIQAIDARADPAP